MPQKIPLSLFFYLSLSLYVYIYISNVPPHSPSRPCRPLPVFRSSHFSPLVCEFCQVSQWPVLLVPCYGVTSYFFRTRTFFIFLLAFTFFVPTALSTPFFRLIRDLIVVTRWSSHTIHLYSSSWSSLHNSVSEKRLLVELCYRNFFPVLGSLDGIARRLAHH